MRKILSVCTILVILLIIGHAGGNSVARPIADTLVADVVDSNVGRVVYLDPDSVFVCGLLKEAQCLSRMENFPLFFARKFIGRPYVAHTLDLFDDERLIVNTSELDCTTLVENVTALTMCVYRRLFTFRDYRNALMALRYRKGMLDGYSSRLHYFSDWIDDKAGMNIVTEIQQPSPPFTAVQKLDINYMTTHTKAYRALTVHEDLVSEIRAQEQKLTGKTYKYIPKAGVKNTRVLRQTVRDGDIIAITCNKKGLDIAHLGFAVWHDDGLHLLNASMLHKKVVEEPMTLYQYLQRHPSHTGIRIIRINR